MEILPSKFRSPPPKPPRRRHSDQLTISPSGTFSSSRKKNYDESKLCLKDMQAKPESSTLGCGSLPANWVADFSPDYTAENSVFKNSPFSYSAHLSKARTNIEMPVQENFDRCNDSLNERLLGTGHKNNANIEWSNKFDRPHFEQVLNSNIFFAKCSAKHFEPAFDPDVGRWSIDGSTIKTNNLISSKSFPKEFHRRHHSDPVLYRLDKSSLKSNIQKCALRSHSFLGTSVYESYDKLCNTFTTSCGYKETQHLYEEIKTLKEINNKLWQHLCSTQSCLEEVKKNTSENTSELSISDFLSSLYYLQKAKDSAMEDRMKVILEERDTAIQELDDMVQVIAKSFEDDAIQEDEKVSDQEIKTLLKEIEVTCNPNKLLHQQRLLLAYLYRSKELRQDHLMHELKLVVSEKNNLLEKVRYLEEELKCLKLCNEVWSSDNKHWENNLLNILCQVIQQRDAALSKIDAVKTLDNVNCRSSADENAFTIEEFTKDYDYHRHGEANFSIVKKKFQTSHNDIKYDLISDESMSDDISLLKGKIAVLSKALEMEGEKRENAEDKCLKLERLVSVLQKKVNGQNVGIHV